MEALILLCLLIVIGLLLWDKMPDAKFKMNFKTNKGSKANYIQKYDDVMGPPKNMKGAKAALDIKVTQVQNLESLSDGIIFDISEDNSMQWDDKTDDAVAVMPNFEEEEEEWRDNYNFYSEGSLATGVTFEELNNLGAMLAQTGTEDTFQPVVSQILRKLDGTELLSLLENSIGDASRKIAVILERGISGHAILDPFERKDDVDAFEISDFT